MQGGRLVSVGGKLVVGGRLPCGRAWSRGISNLLSALGVNFFVLLSRVASPGAKVLGGAFGVE